MRLGLVGVGYFPFLIAGEKNFYFRLVPELRPKLDDLVVISVNDAAERISHQDTPAGEVPIYNFVRPIDGRRDNRHFGTTNGVRHYHHRHNAMREIGEKSATLLLGTRRIRQIVKDHSLDWLYFLDNFGPGMAYARRAFGTSVGFAAANYQPRGARYDALQQRFVQPLDLVVTYSKAYRDILRTMLPAERIEVIHWGVDPEGFTPRSQADRDAARAELGISPGATLVVWSGFLQQIQAEDFRRTVAIAREVRSARRDIEFLFCFKPETYRADFSVESADGVQVLCGVPRFVDLLAAADVFLSPVGNVRSTVSPPLTWIEAMSMGTPVLSTRVGGAAEVIDDGVSGYLVDGYAQLADALRRMGSPTESMRAAARRTVIDRYQIATAAARHIDAFQKRGRRD
ncbi:MAG TPA: glycosyltransferase family 4 protein [Mycobacteriales bacterium]|nr:glycosyltransferase family 4 protein [Mycobacteriales bacterium]HWA68164.1 glycosyltransferase family 4 protein [Mycobacteriales bacterium]